MVEQCHRTLESVITKVMETQEDWPVLLNSILFSMHCHTHSSTRYSPICLLFSKDPIWPFELVNKKVSTMSWDLPGNDSENDHEFNDHGVDPDDPADNNNDSTKGVTMNKVDEVFQMVQKIEKE